MCARAYFGNDLNSEYQQARRGKLEYKFCYQKSGYVCSIKALPEESSKYIMRPIIIMAMDF